jgi:hypothetical protein
MPATKRLEVAMSMPGAEGLRRANIPQYQPLVNIGPLIGNLQFNLCITALERMCTVANRLGVST